MRYLSNQNYKQIVPICLLDTKLYYPSSILNLTSITAYLSYESEDERSYLSYDSEDERSWQ